MSHVGKNLLRPNIEISSSFLACDFPISCLYRRRKGLPASSHPMTTLTPFHFQWKYKHLFLSCLPPFTSCSIFIASYSLVKPPLFSLLTLNRITSNQKYLYETEEYIYIFHHDMMLLCTYTNTHISGDNPTRSLVIDFTDHQSPFTDVPFPDSDVPRQQKKKKVRIDVRLPSTSPPSSTICPPLFPSSVLWRILQCLGLDPSPILRLITNTQLVRLTLRRTRRIGTIQQILNPQQHLLDGDGRSPPLLFVQNTQTDGA